MVPPKRWDRGTVTMQLYCTNDGLTTETAPFTAAGVAISKAKLIWTSNASSDD